MGRVCFVLRVAGALSFSLDFSRSLSRSLSISRSLSFSLDLSFSLVLVLSPGAGDTPTGLCSKEFICTEGKDGYDGFVDCPVLVDAEANPALPTLVQRHCEVGTK